MNKTWIIIGSIVLVLFLVLGGMWWYLLMNGRPEALDGVQNPFSAGEPNEFAPTRDMGELANQPRAFATTLRKITGAAVAGSVFIETDDTTYIRYAERGTGHLFEADPVTGNTTRISNTTVPRTIEALWSPQGLRVVLVSETATGDTRVFAGSIERNDEGEGAFSSSELNSGAENIAFARTGETVYYTTHTSSGSTGYAHNLITGERTVRFSSPLRDISVTWEPSLVVYTKPTATLPGYVYAGPELARVAGGVNGLMAVPLDDHLVLSHAQDDTLISYTNTSSQGAEGTVLAIPVIPEKCATDTVSSTVLWCGAPVALAAGAYPDQWYQGVVSFNDIIWKVDVETGSATLVSIPSEDVGEAIDVIDVSVSENGDMLIFTNKKDGALWVQEID